MRTILFYCALPLLFICTILQAQESAVTQRRPQFRHDPLNPMVHDPVLAKEGNTYYMFCTGMGVGRFSSKDLKVWERQPGCFTDVPASVKNVFSDAGNHLWAPDIIFHNGLWHLFYSSSAFGKNTSVIGHATSPTLDSESNDYEWTDNGIVIQSVPNRDNWNAIDPNIIIDDNGSPWMNFGSFWGGMKLVKLTNNLNEVSQPEEWRTLSRRPRSFAIDEANPGDAAVEAPFIYKHGNWYYLFVSFDYCCRGKDSTYKVVVGRSKSVEGSYLDKEGENMALGGGSIVLEGDNENWAAVGHCAAYTFDGLDVFVAHGYTQDTGQSRLVLRTINWENEWPVIKW